MDGDRISRLPDYILHRILSFLEPPEERHRSYTEWYPAWEFDEIPNNHEAARAACLSKSWLSVWLTYPYLTFNFAKFYNQEWEEKFERYVENTISRFSKSELSVQSVTLVEPPDSMLPSLIRFVVEKHVKILHVDSPERFPSELPDTIFGAKSLIELKLTCCRFPDTKIELTNLKKVIFDEVDLPDQLFDKLFSNCPLIEEIDLFLCILCFKRVCNVPKLKRFRMLKCIENCNCEMVEIDAPSLESFEIDDACPLNLDACRSLRRICLSSTNKALKDMSFSKFMYLEDLELFVIGASAWLENERLNISSQSLRRVHIWEPHTKWEMMIDAPNLRQLQYSGYRLNSVSFQNPPIELRINVYMFNDMVESPSTWSLDFRNFLMKLSSRTKIYLSLDVSDLRGCLEIQEDSQEFPKPEVEHLALNLFPGKINQQALVNGLLWSCHPRYISVRWYYFEPDCELIIEYLWNNVSKRASGSILNCCQHQQPDDANTESSIGSFDAYKTLEEVMKAAKAMKVVYFKL